MSAIPLFRTVMQTYDASNPKSNIRVTDVGEVALNLFSFDERVLLLSELVRLRQG